MIEEQVLSYVIGKKRWDFIIGNDIDSSWFFNNKQEFLYIQRYVNMYSETPNLDTFLGVFENFDYMDIDLSEQYLLAEFRYHRLMNCFVGELNRGRDIVVNPDIDHQKAMDDIAAIVAKLSEQTVAGQSLMYMDSNSLADLARTAFDERSRSFTKHFYEIGIPWLDKNFLGWDKDNDYVVIAGRPGTGKSMLLCKMAAEQIKRGKKVAFYEGEMSKEQTFERILAAMSGISATDMLRAKDDIREDYFREVNKFENLSGKLFMMTPMEIGSKYPTTYQLETFVKKTNADILFIDQLSLMNDLDRAKVPYERMANISRQIKGLRDKLNIPVLCACQMNRVKNDNGVVDNNQIAGSDVIVQDATRVIMLVSNRDDEDNKITMNISKNRTGNSYGKRDFKVDFAKCKWDELEDDGTEVEQNETYHVASGDNVGEVIF